jgi:NADH pyrophosphatase NudC (nudix superfamily)
MNKRFNPHLLTTNRHEVLVLLMEECAEVIQECSKCIRGGFQFKATSTNELFLDRLKKELVDLKLIITTFDDLEPTSQEQFDKWTREKLEKLSRWTDVFLPKFCPNCGDPTQGKIKVGNSVCDKCVAELYDENK